MNQSWLFFQTVQLMLFKKYILFIRFFFWCSLLFLEALACNNQPLNPIPLLSYNYQKQTKHTLDGCFHYKTWQLQKCKLSEEFKSIPSNQFTLAKIHRLANYITRPNGALDRSTILCLYVAGFQRQVLKYDPKSKWVPQTSFSGLRIHIPVR